MMLRAMLEGVDGVSLDLIAFSEAYERCKGALIPDVVIEVDARVDFRGDQMQLIVEAVRQCADPAPVLDAPHEERFFHIWLPPEYEDELPHRLYELLKAFPGDDRVWLHCQGKKLLPRLRVDADGSLTSAARALVGNNAVRLDVVTHASVPTLEAYSAD